MITKLETRYPDSDFPCLMRASLLQREKRSDKAVSLLQVGTDHESAAWVCSLIYLKFRKLFMSLHYLIS